MGLNELEAKEQGIAYEVTTYGIDDLDRAIADSEDHGFVKVLTEPGKDKIIGATIFSAHASDIIAEFVLAMRHGLGLNKIMGTIHIYPTLAEANKYTAGEWKKAHAPGKILDWIEKYHRFKRSVPLKRARTTTLQINVGLKCNQACTHCHLSAGPGRKELMTRETVAAVLKFIERNPVSTIDITGGAPELHPDLPYFMERLAGFDSNVILRANLSMLHAKKEPFVRFLVDQGVHIVASFPSLNPNQLEALRGKGMFAVSLETLKLLNRLGYGKTQGPLQLDLVVNPAVAFLSPDQKSLEKRYKKILAEKQGITFNRLYSFANVSLGRFKEWLARTGNYEAYMGKLKSAFNPAAVAGVMCRTLFSVAWDGILYDCDFNLAAGRTLGEKKQHIADLPALPPEGQPIRVADHCYTCTAGAGFT